MSGPRQRTNVGEVRGGSRELRIAVGRHVDAVKGLVVQGVGERQRNGGDLIVPGIAAISCAWHDAAAYLSDGIIADARSRRSSRCRAWSARWRWPSGIAVGANEPIANQADA